MLMAFMGKVNSAGVGGEFQGRTARTGVFNFFWKMRTVARSVNASISQLRRFKFQGNLETGVRPVRGCVINPSQADPNPLEMNERERVFLFASSRWLLASPEIMARAKVPAQIGNRKQPSTWLSEGNPRCAMTERYDGNPLLRIGK
jgi:hypothetical protein